jgi:OmpA-OmpF porin, OOP family
MIKNAWILLVAALVAAGCASTETPKPAPQPEQPRQAAPPPEVKPAPAPAPKPKPVAEKVTFAADVHFDFDKATLKPAGKAKLDDLAAKVGGMNLEVVIAIGHADEIGSDAYNMKLSVRRAEAVKKYLVSKSIEANRVYTEGKGKRQPVASNKTKEGRAKNRRVEIEVIGTRKN